MKKSIFVLICIILSIAACNQFSESARKYQKTEEIITETVEPSLTPTQTPTIEPTVTPRVIIYDSQVSEVDGMTMVYIPAGDFIMGSDEGYDSEKPEHNVYLDSYWIDQTEVTNDMFAKFVEERNYITSCETNSHSMIFIPDGKYKKEHGSCTFAISMTRSSWMHPQGSDSNIEGLGNHPVVQVSWVDANAYCQWAGRRLPTEAEWEKAARGESGGTYPWGEEAPNGNFLNTADVSIKNACISDINIDDGYAYTAPVGSYPAGASPYGVLDMAGNVEEWTFDYKLNNYYSSMQEWINPKGPSADQVEIGFEGRLHVIKGGAYSHLYTTTSRSGGRAKDTNDWTGFRCAFSDPVED